MLGLGGGLLIALVARISVVQAGSEFHDDPRNAFVRGTINPSESIPTIRSADGVVVARSVPNGERSVRVYPQDDLVPVLGILRPGTYPTGIERLVASEGGDPSKERTLLLDTRLQGAALRALGDHRGSVLVVGPGGSIRAAVDTAATRAPASSGTVWPVGGEPSLFDRTVAPGSTLKPLVAATAVDAGLVSPKESFPPRTGYQPLGGRWIDNFDRTTCAPGDLELALAQSCNATAVEIAERLGPAGLRTALRSYGFGSAPDGLSAASIPALANGWPSSVDEASLAVLGQGEARVTLVGLGLAYSALGNGGPVPTPRWFTDDPAGELRPGPWQDNGREVALAGMRQAASSGTAKALHGLGLAAKTGTATRSSDGDSDGWIVVLVEGEHGTTVVVIRIDGSARSATGGDAAAVAARLFASQRALLEEKP
jgi:cell division protein FtsI/penicillin-binding protein 2